LKVDELEWSRVGKMAVLKVGNWDLGSVDRKGACLVDLMVKY
jgi:hypothetical protein